VFNADAITYDAMGNPLTNGGWTYTWQQGRELASAKSSSYTISYEYNDQGLRTSKTVNGVTTNYTLDGNGSVICAKNPTGTMWLCYNAQGNPVSFELNGVPYYYTFNLQGDVTGILDQTGAVVVQYVYGAFGSLRATTGTLASTVGAKNLIRYRGYWYDAETGLYYLQSRYYNIMWGRFLNADCLVDTQDWANSANMFAYCSNNPVGKTDPDGRYSVDNALAYASKWWNGYNPSFPPWGNDCANFVSQCLNAGGWWRTINWFYFRLKDIPAWALSLVGVGISLVMNLTATGNVKIKVTKSWGTADGLCTYLKNNRNITPTQYTDRGSFEKAVKDGKVKNGAVAFQVYKVNGVVHHAVMIGRIDKANGKAYYYAHTNPRNAKDNSSNVSVNLIDNIYKIYVFNIS